MEDIRELLGEEAFVHTVEHEWELTEAVRRCTGIDFSVRNCQRGRRRGDSFYAS